MATIISLGEGGAARGSLVGTETSVGAGGSGGCTSGVEATAGGSGGLAGPFGKVRDRDWARRTPSRKRRGKVAKIQRFPRRALRVAGLFSVVKAGVGAGAAAGGGGVPAFWSDSRNSAAEE